MTIHTCDDHTYIIQQEEGHTGFLHLPSAVLAFIFVARRIQPFHFLVDREVEFRVLTLVGQPSDVGTLVRISVQSHELGFLPTKTKFKIKRPKSGERLNPSREKN